MLHKELAEKLGVTDIALRASLKGNPTVGTLEKVATALGVDFLDLFRERTDFLAILEVKGELRKFTSKQELSAFLDTIRDGHTG